MTTEKRPKEKLAGRKKESADPRIKDTGSFKNINSLSM